MFALTLAVSGAHAQELEPRAYGNTPTGLNFLIVGYGYSQGGVVTDPSIPLKNAHVEVHGTVLAYVRSLDVWGRSGKLEVVLPYAWASGTAEFVGQPRERQVSGLGDPRLRLSVNLLSASRHSPSISLRSPASDYARLDDPAKKAKSEVPSSSPHCA